MPQARGTAGLLDTMLGYLQDVRADLLVVGSEALTTSSGASFAPGGGGSAFVGTVTMSLLRRITWMPTAVRVGGAAHGCFGLVSVQRLVSSATATSSHL